MVWVILTVDLGVGEKGIMFYKKHPLLMSSGLGVRSMASEPSWYDLNDYIITLRTNYTNFIYSILNSSCNVFRTVSSR